MSEIQTQINQIIKKSRSKNPWRIYKRIKQYLLKYPLDSADYDKLVRYACDRLNI